MISMVLAIGSSKAGEDPSDKTRVKIWSIAHGKLVEKLFPIIFPVPHCQITITVYFGILFVIFRYLVVWNRGGYVGYPRKELSKYSSDNMSTEIPKKIYHLIIFVYFVWLSVVLKASKEGELGSGRSEEKLLYLGRGRSPHSYSLLDLVTIYISCLQVI